ncbi:hypothetical protein FIU97_08275 [Roseivivax sp. THAF40]|uniref:DUF924 family protein n=1 Tax=unclassified Roseivivax TaxID=2639302 RepID=UPI001268928D|nr:MULTISPECIES: DUF924 family protein [unclassified Roseivivax]QFS82794.1 hypothetical protein FIV09_08170 [Roseivivax sp. THAF197b]QFT46563.1 hypothetical protein FIU97_08275 [Roseivivax sp. THAF40]
MTGPKEILAFWLDEVGPKGWYKQDDALDATIRERFLPVLEEAMEGRFALWLTYPSGVLAYIILLDQFPRNMFRGEARAFASDPVALAAAKQAVRREWDLRIDAPARQFFYLPMMHSENLCDQEHCIRLVKDRMPNAGGDTLLHARVHREVIRQFGRFPYRNDALSRTSTASESAFMDEGGYGEILREMQKEAA